jgi:hypothetical protein
MVNPLSNENVSKSKEKTNNSSNNSSNSKTNASSNSIFGQPQTFLGEVDQFIDVLSSGGYYYNETPVPEEFVPDDPYKGINVSQEGLEQEITEKAMSGGNTSDFQSVTQPNAEVLNNEIILQEENVPIADIPENLITETPVKEISSVNNAVQESTFTNSNLSEIDALAESLEQQVIQDDIPIARGLGIYKLINPHLNYRFSYDNIFPEKTILKDPAQEVSPTEDLSGIELSLDDSYSKSFSKECISLSEGLEFGILDKSIPIPEGDLNSVKYDIAKLQSEITQKNTAAEENSDTQKLGINELQLKLLKQQLAIHEKLVGKNADNNISPEEKEKLLELFKADKERLEALNEIAEAESNSDLETDSKKVKKEKPLPASSYKDAKEIELENNLKTVSETRYKLANVVANRSKDSEEENNKYVLKQLKNNESMLESREHNLKRQLNFLEAHRESNPIPGSDATKSAQEQNLEQTIQQLKTRVLDLIQNEYESFDRDLTDEDRVKEREIKYRVYGQALQQYEDQLKAVRTGNSSSTSSQPINEQSFVNQLNTVTGNTFPSPYQGVTGLTSQQYGNLLSSIIANTFPSPYQSMNGQPLQGYGNQLNIGNNFYSPYQGVTGNIFMQGDTLTQQSDYITAILNNNPFINYA